eukprot:2393931-Amphidinium_carterae.3
MSAECQANKQENATWTTTDAQGMQQVPSALSWFQYCHDQDCWDTTPWMPLLFLDQSVLHKLGSDAHYVVLGATPYGMYLWPLGVETEDSRKLKLWILRWYFDFHTSFR